MADKVILSARGITVGYGKKAVVRDLTFGVKAGEILTLIGPNGAGKSTVLKSIAAQLPLISGSVSICGSDTARMSEREIAKLLSLCLTDRITAERMTCEDIVATGRYPYTGRLGILADSDKAVVREAMELTGTLPLAETDFRKLSDGQRQTVMLARAIAQQPKVMLLDEPTSFLDINNKLRLLTILRELVREKGIAVVQSLHELDLAQRFSDKLLCIRDSRADRIGTPEEIFSGDYISDLYAIERGTFEPLYGAAEAERNIGAPRVFVIGGGGSGLAVYRRLQRQGIPFAAGVIHENDIDYPAAKALAAQLVSERAYEPVSTESLAAAKRIIDKCDTVICAAESFGAMNIGNRELAEYAYKLGKISNT